MNHQASPRTDDPLRLFADYLRVTGVAHTQAEPAGLPELRGRRLGLLNGSSWVTLWSTYFGRRFLPGAHLVNIGNEAVQIAFMEAHEQGLPCPPQSNVDAFVRYAHDLVNLAHVDAVLITCSTMNRAYRAVEASLAGQGVPVIQIDQPMMQRAVEIGGHALVIATHGPTVGSTQALLRETAESAGKALSFGGLTLEAAWHQLAAGDVDGHNDTLARAIRAHLARERTDSVVLAQLSMSALLLSYPDPLAEFGIPVLTSAQCGFERVREILTTLNRHKPQPKS